MTIEVNKAKAKLDSVEKDLKQMTNLNKVCLSPYGVAFISVLIIQFDVGPQSIPDRASREMARVPQAYCASVQARVPVPSLAPWILRQGVV
jgi:hypothetical protein